MDKIICTRCLGKGHVDEADIARLERESQWLPDKCAFCNGSGKIYAVQMRSNRPCNPLAYLKDRCYFTM
jgi:DnaJ-class molecular chaperone